MGCCCSSEADAAELQHPLLHNDANAPPSSLSALLHLDDDDVVDIPPPTRQSSQDGALQARRFREKRHRRGTLRHRLHKQAQATSERGIRPETVRCPDPTARDAWLAVHMVDFFNDIVSLSVLVEDCCSARSCPVMSAGDFTYLWADGAAVTEPMKLPAPLYVQFFLDWYETRLSDEALFPEEDDAEYPEHFARECRTMAKRLFRVYAHLYHGHFQDFSARGCAAHLNTCFKWFIVFSLEHRLVPLRELQPLQPIVDKLLEEAGAAPLQDGAASPERVPPSANGSSGGEGSTDGAEERHGWEGHGHGGFARAASVLVETGEEAADEASGALAAEENSAVLSREEEVSGTRSLDAAPEGPVDDVDGAEEEARIEGMVEEEFEAIVGAPVEARVQALVEGPVQALLGLSANEAPETSEEDVAPTSTAENSVDNSLGPASDMREAAPSVEEGISKTPQEVAESSTGSADAHEASNESEAGAAPDGKDGRQGNEASDGERSPASDMPDAAPEHAEMGKEVAQVPGEASDASSKALAASQPDDSEAGEA